LEHFATDASIFRAIPAAVIYPNNTADVRKTVKFAAERASVGKPASLVARGKGSGRAGGAVGEGMQVVFPTHMNKLLRLDRDSVTVQPGIVYRTLQQTLHTHGRYLPPYPANLDIATVGGAVATDAAGLKSYKYGTTRAFVKGLKVVLSDGSIVQTHRISSRELSRKKGLSTFEGEIYRKLDGLLLDHADLIDQHQPKTTRNSAGYSLGQVRAKDGSFDLSQVIIGSEGTLGLVTEVTLRTLPYNPRATLLVGYFDSIDGASEAVLKLRELGPSALEMVNYHVLAALRAHQPADLDGLVPEELPKIMLFAEFDNASQITQKLKTNRAARIFSRHKASVRVSADPIEQVALWKILHDASSTGWLTPTHKPTLPFLDDATVPADRLPHFLDKCYKLFAKHDLDAALWGHAGDGNLTLEPALDLSKRRDSDKLFHLAREFYDAVIALGGTTSGGEGDGLLRSLYLHQLYGDNMMELFTETKHIFDPHSIFNPGKKTEASEDYARAHLRDEYTLGHLYEYLNVT
jgi:FAD/FMN-containing dehydrogenase